MPDLTVPVVSGQANHSGIHTDERTEINALRGRTAVLEGTAFGSGSPGQVALDSFAGATDDDKLTAALAYVSAQTVKSVIRLANRTYSFTQSRTTFSGLRIAGPEGGFQNSEISAGALTTCVVNLNCGVGTSSWLVGSAQTYDIYIANIGFRSSNGNTQFYHHPLSAGTSYATWLHSLGFSGFKHVLGQPTNKFSATLLVCDGGWNITTTRDTQITIGGADSDIFNDGCNIGPDNTNFTGTATPLIIFSDFGKSNVGPIFFTCDNGYYGIQVSSGTNYGSGLKFRGLRVEGRNPSDPSDGYVIRIDGGTVVIRDFWAAYGMAAPTLNGMAAQGMIQVNGGTVLIDGVTYDRSAAVGQDVPLVAVTNPAAKLRVFNVDVGTRGGAWTLLPVVQTSNGATAVTDDTTRKIAV